MSRKTPREIETLVVDLDEQGLGRAAFESRQVRVRNALPGETVTVRVLKRRRGVWFGEASTPERSSDRRRAPPCGYYPRCGGCSLQHLNYQDQLGYKQDLLLNALSAVGVEPRRVRAPVAGPQLHYRYKARLGLRVVGDELLAGFREALSNRVVRMDDCKTLAVPLAGVLPLLKQTLAHMSRPDRIPQVELAGGDRQFAIVVRHLTPLDGRDHELLEDFSRRTGMQVFLQPGGYESVAPLDHGNGDGSLCYSNPDFGLCYRFLPTDFTQVNPFINRVLVRNAVLALAPHPGGAVIDLFCGIGNFSLALARAGAQVLGLENAAGAVDRARLNAEINGLSSHAEFAVMDLYDARCPELAEADYLLLDPPRSGAGPNLARWAGSRRLQRIAYVSCSPGSFATDAARLLDLGFELEEAGVYDMFPQTAHVETLGLFSRHEPACRRG